MAQGAWYISYLDNTIKSICALLSHSGWYRP
jgi:hypothetical protein